MFEHIKFSVKEEVISENESMVTTPSSIPPVSKVQNKPKRVFFDISNPLFREPFKYGKIILKVFKL